MKIAKPNLPVQQEEAIELEEAISMAGAYGEPLEGYSFTGENAAGQDLCKAEMRMCRFANCCFTGTQLANAWLQDTVFEGCDLSGVMLADATLKRVSFHNCKLSGTNFSAAFLEDVSFENAVARGAVFNEAALRRVLFSGSDFADAGFGAIKIKSKFQFEKCSLERAYFLHTSLSGQDLTSNVIEGAFFSGAQELRGAKVTVMQACELARLLGVIIE